jgi:hypothetical protein
MKYPLLFQINSYGTGYIEGRFSMNSWRTLTLSFINNSSSGGKILVFGPLTILVKGSDIIFKWKEDKYNNTLDITRTFTNVCPPNTPCYIMVNMRSIQDNTYPTVLQLYAGPFGSINKSSIIPFTSNNNQPLYNINHTGYFIALGENSDLNRNFSISIGSLRLFDYELFPEEVAIDQANTWQMKYFI